MAELHTTRVVGVLSEPQAKETGKQNILPKGQVDTRELSQNALMLGMFGINGKGKSCGP